MTPRLPKHLQSGRPKYGVPPTDEQNRDREKLLKKFGEHVDERRADRRQMSMTPSEVETWLKHNGINGGDRRKGDRRIR